DAGTDFAVPDGTLTVENDMTVSSTKTTDAGVTTGPEVSVERFTLDTPTLFFSVQGYTTSSVSNRGRGHDILDNTSPVTLNSKANGGATVGGNDGVVQGTITASGRKVEVT